MSKNRKRGLLILGIGIMVVMVSLFLPAKNKILNTENQIERNTYGGGERDVSLLVVSSLGENSVDYSIGERKYTQAEAQDMLSDFISLIEVQVLGENVSPDNISSDLNYVDEVEGYPFEVSWSCDHSDLIGTEGNIREEIKENTPVMLAANIEYEELEYEHIFPVVLVPREYTSQEQWLNDIEDAVYLADKESSNDPFVTLPQQVNGKVRQIFTTLADELDAQVSPDVRRCMASTLDRIADVWCPLVFILMELSASLGKFDMHGQLRAIARARSLCDEKLRQLQQGKENRLRSYQTLGICAGASLAILFV